MPKIDSQWVLVFAGALIALSYVFNQVSTKTKIPSVLLLILTGVGVKFGLQYFHIAGFEKQFFYALELLGTIGLVLIVLEAAVELKLSKEKAPVIRKSILLAALVLVVTSVGIAAVIMLLRGSDFYKALVYAIPLSVVSSAVLIPSVHSLSGKKKEFMIYESTFSDIIGIMFFNFVVIEEIQFNSGEFVSMSGVWNILLTVAVSVALSYVLVAFFCKINSKIKIFLMLAVLMILYGLGKSLHFSALLFIFVFGLVLNNPDVFFKGRLKKLMDAKTARANCGDFRIITAESAFLVRTFFFVAFGMSINLNELLDWNVLLIGSIIVVLLYAVRYLNFKLFLKTDVFPEIFLAPRGLITILLFTKIPEYLKIEGFSDGNLFFVILTTGIIMMIALMKTPSGDSEEMKMIDIGLSPTIGRSETEPSGPHCEFEPDDEKKNNN